VLRAVVRAHGSYHDDTSQATQQIHRTLCSVSAGEASAELFLALLDPLRGRIRYSTAGGLGAVLVRGRKWESLPPEGPLLGGSAPPRAEQHQRVLAPGETLLVFPPRLLRLLAGEAGDTDVSSLVRAVLADDSSGNAPAAAQVASIRRSLGDALPAGEGPLSLLALRHRG
jgi:hypothetical protein